MARRRVFSGIQPTGELHLGNYFGAIQNWVRLQEEYDCIYCVVDYHAITERVDTETLARRSLDLAGALIACGIDPERSILFVQSHVPEHTELAWVLNCFASYGDLTRMTQFKEKSERADHVSAGLFTYPVLQAADILLYRASRVPVGEDQVQHLELTRRIGRRFNSTTETDLFPEVEPILSEGKRIMSLADPTRKMSKSLGDKHYIGLMEDPQESWSKIRSAVTDPGGEVGEEMSPGVANLFTLLRLSATDEVVDRYRRQHVDGELMYGELKESVRDHLLETLEPIRRRRRELSDARIVEILDDGARRARTSARETMDEVRRILRVGPDSLDRP